MKKILSLIYIIVVILSILVGCGTSDVAKNTESKASIDSATATDSSVTTKELSENSNITKDIEKKPESEQLKYFNFTVDEFVSYFDKALTAKGLKTVIKDKPDVEGRSFYEYGNVNLYSYYWETGGVMYIYADKDDNKVINVSLNADTNILKDLSKFYFCIGLVTGMIDPNSAKEVSNKLNVNNSSKDTVTIATGENGDYIYSVDNGNLMLLISPVTIKESPKNIKTTEEFEKKPESNKLTYFDHTVDEFVAFFDKTLIEKGFGTIINEKFNIKEGTIDDYGDINTYYYYWETGGILILQANKEDNRLIKVILSADTNVHKNVDEFYFCLGLVKGMLEPNSGKELTQKLNLLNNSEDAITTATGKYGEFIYSVDGGNLMLIVTPKK